MGASVREIARTYGYLARDAEDSIRVLVPDKALAA